EGNTSTPTMILFNVVFALRANDDPSVINCLHTLSRRIATVLQHNERRCQYLTRESKMILALQDEVSDVADATTVCARLVWCGSTSTAGWK
uniref:Uncharacterized protein n=1 Tax=Sciurus vulgaris TaxID=55149 RepID=A0A8D2APG9_SCIVU